MRAGRRCRLCLGRAGLVPIFVRAAAHARYSAVLALATGLRIEMDDGLPQAICNECIISLNNALYFRNQSHRAERKLLKWGYQRKESRRQDIHQVVENRDSPGDLIKKEESSSTIFDDRKEFEPATEFNNFCDIDYEKSGDNISPNFNNYAFESENEIDIEKTDILEIITKNQNQNVKTKEIDIEKADISEIIAKDQNQNVKIEKIDTSVNKRRKMKLDKKKRYEHLVEGPMGPRNPGPFECKSCKKVLKSWSSFRTHAKIHLGFDFMCEYCGKRFIAVTMLQRHCMSQHGTEKTYRCKYCDHRTLDSERLKIHERRDHTGDRPYVCDACAASFHTRRNLVNHLAVHMTQRTVQCTKCPTKFKSAQHLACHTSKVHTHRDVRMQCYLCDNTYTKYENVRKHLMKIHGVPRQRQLAITRVRVPVEA